MFLTHFSLIIRSINQFPLHHAQIHQFSSNFIFFSRGRWRTARHQPGALTVVDRLGSAATTRLQFGVNIIPLQERSGGAITDSGEGGERTFLLRVGLSAGVGGGGGGEKGGGVEGPGAVRGEAGGEGV